MRMKESVEQGDREHTATTTTEPPPSPKLPDWRCLLSAALNHQMPHRENLFAIIDQCHLHPPAARFYQDTQVHATSLPLPQSAGIKTEVPCRVKGACAGASCGAAISPSYGYNGFLGVWTHNSFTSADSTRYKSFLRWSVSHFQHKGGSKCFSEGQSAFSRPLSSAKFLFTDTGFLHL